MNMEGAIKIVKRLTGKDINKNNILYLIQNGRVRKENNKINEKDLIEYYK